MDRRALRDDFLIDHRVIRQLPDAIHDVWEPAGEILLVARPELDAAAGLAAYRTKAVKLHLVAPFTALGWALGALAKASARTRTDFEKALADRSLNKASKSKPAISRRQGRLWKMYMGNAQGTNHRKFRA
jgi:hypothetical protein